MHFHEQINVPRSNASTLPRGSYNNKPIFIEDGLHEDESSNGSESTSMYSNPVNYSTVKKNNSNFLNREVRFTPKYFEFPLTEKRYKNYNATFSTKSQLPSISLSKSVFKKLVKSLSQSSKKPSYLLASKQTDESTPEKWYVADEITYSIEDCTTFEESYYELQKYPVLCITANFQSENAPSMEETSLFDNEIAIFEKLCKESRNGIQSLFSFESSNKLNDSSFPQEVDTSELNVKPLRNSDIVYLNLFRVFSVIIKSEVMNIVRYKIQKMVYFPNVSFNVAAIHQPFKLVSSPLTSLLTTKKPNAQPSSGKSSKKSSIKFGFLSLASNQRLLPLAASDPMCAQVPILGLWVSGISSKLELIEQNEEEKNLLIGFMFEYINNTSIKNRFSFDQERKTFLLLVFSPEEGSKFYEVEFMDLGEDPEIENRWLLLRHSVECLDQKDLLNQSHWSFQFSKSLLAFDFQFLRKPMLTPLTQASKNTPFNKKTLKRDDSLTKYISATKNHNISIPQPSTSEDHEDEELDFYDANFMLPKPQPQPSIVRQLEESKDSQKTATFIHGNEQTFAHEAVQSKGGLAGQTVLTESIRKWNGQSNLNNFSLQSNSHSNSLAQSGRKEKSHNHSRQSHNTSQHNQSHNTSHQEEKLSPFAEKLLAQQAEQLKFLQEQILTLQTVVLNYHNNFANPASMHSMSMAHHQSTSSPDHMTPVSTAKFGTFRNNLSARQFTSVKKDFMMQGGEEFTLDSRSMAPDSQSQRFMDELENAKKQIKMETKSTNTTFVVNKEEAAPKPNPSNSRDVAIDTGSNLAITETSMRYEPTNQINDTMKGGYDPSVYNHFESINRDVLLSHRNNYSKELDKKSDLEGLSISKIEKIDDSMAMDENRMSREFQTMQVLRRESEQEDQRLLRDITNEPPTNTFSNNIIQPTNPYKRQESSSKKGPTDTRLERGELDLPKLDLPRVHSDTTYIKTQLPRNEGTLDSIVSDREFIKLKVPEDSLLSSRNSNAGFKFSAENKENQDSSRVNILPPLESRNSSIQVPKIKYHLKNFANDDSDDDEKQFENIFRRRKQVN